MIMLSMISKKSVAKFTISGAFMAGACASLIPDSHYTAAPTASVSIPIPEAINTNHPQDKQDVSPLSEKELDLGAPDIRPLIGYMIYTDTSEPVGGIYGEKNPDMKFNPASATKIFIVNETLKRIQDGTLDPNKVIDIPHPKLISTNNELQHGDALHNYAKFPGGKIQQEVKRASVANVLKAIMIGSSNIGCIALSNDIFGSEKKAVAFFNNRAKEKGWTDFHMGNTSGFPTKHAASNHYMTARILLGELKDVKARMDDMRADYPDMINGMNGSSVTINAFDKNGETSYKITSHSKLMIEGPLHVDGISVLKTNHSRFSPESRFGTMLITDIKVGGEKREIAYLASGFPTQMAREEWIHHKIVKQTPLLVENDLRTHPNQEVKQAAVISASVPALSEVKSDNSGIPLNMAFGLAAITALGALGYAQARSMRPQKAGRMKITVTYYDRAQSRDPG